MLCPAARTAAHQRLELCVHHEVGEPRAVRRDPRPRQRRSELLASPRLTALQRPRQNFVAAREHALVEVVPCVPVPVERVNPGGRQAQHPSDVIRRDEVPRRPQDVRSQDLTPRERLLDVGLGAVACPLADRPLRLGEFLGLHGTEPADGVLRPVEGLSGQALVVKPSAYHSQRVHPGARVYEGWSARPLGSVTG